VEKLMKLDKGTLEIPSKEITMKLAKLKGEEVTFRCKAIDPERMSEIQEESFEIVDGNMKIVNTFKMKALMITESCDDVFKNADLLKHFKAPSPIELMKEIMLNGEIDDLNEVVQAVNGYEKDLKKKNK
ncbi:phage tail assembly chaperone, partial [Clostridium botulinum]